MIPFFMRRDSYSLLKTGWIIFTGFGDLLKFGLKTEPVHTEGNKNSPAKAGL
jgi:hypothetical protein